MRVDSLPSGGRRGSMRAAMRLARPRTTRYGTMASVVATISSLARVNPAQDDDLVDRVQDDGDEEQLAHVLPTVPQQVAPLRRVRTTVQKKTGRPSRASFKPDADGEEHGDRRLNDQPKSQGPPTRATRSSHPRESMSSMRSDCSQVGVLGGLHAATAAAGRRRGPAVGEDNIAIRFAAERHTCGGHGFCASAGPRNTMTLRCATAELSRGIVLIQAP